VAVTVSELIACLEKLDPTAPVTTAHEDYVDFEAERLASPLVRLIQRANGGVTLLYTDADEAHDPHPEIAAAVAAEAEDPNDEPDPDDAVDESLDDCE
jgi:hypothetical protein